ncbi:UNVERIFIED_CONTAM: hypothetical protein GTU68_008247 [Idotea baltica]|nr:hypothetical protein [Idotea baltica]
MLLMKLAFIYFYNGTK